MGKSGKKWGKPVLMGGEEDKKNKNGAKEAQNGQRRFGTIFPAFCVYFGTTSKPSGSPDSFAHNLERIGLIPGDYDLPIRLVFAYNHYAVPRAL
ncbi:hypothetical protein R84981_001739 [Carnimonas sp. R-84981]